MGLSGVSRVRCPVGDGSRGLSGHTTPTTASHAVVSGPFQRIGGRSSGSGDGRRPRRLAQTVENLLNGVGRVDRCHDFHTSPAARAFEDVQFPYSFHEFGPCVIPAVPERVWPTCFVIATSHFKPTAVTSPPWPMLKIQPTRSVLWTASPKCGPSAATNESYCTQKL